MASFQNMGPACCCCNHLYVSFAGSDNLRRYDTKGTVPYLDITDIPAEATPGRTLDFDPVHKIVFGTRGTSPAQDHEIAKFDHDLANRVTLATMGASEYPSTITSDSDNQKAYYTSYDIPTTTTKRLNVINHDGSGDAYVADLTNTNAGVVHIPIHYCRANGKLYYCSDSPKKLYSINVDGTADTLLASGATTNSNIVDCTVDNDNSVLWWIDNAAFNTKTSRIYKSDLAGGGATLMLSGAAINSAIGPMEFFQGVQWSHKKQRLYFWWYDDFIGVPSDTTRGLMSMLADGTDIQLHIPRGDPITLNPWNMGTNVPTDWRLGCGYENTGASSTA